MLQSLSLLRLSRRSSARVRANLETFAKEQAGRLLILKLDTQANYAAGSRFGIQAIPTIVLVRDGREVDRVAGALPLDQLRQVASHGANGVPS